jgi:4-hydroxy-tetrahydrodipicolinate synthase
MKGVYTALVTPFDSHGALDLKAFRKILDDQIDAKVAGVIPCGTTGETPTLSVEEKQKLIHLSVEACRGTGVKVLAGTGTNNTEETVSFSKWASDQGVDGILVVTPYYNKPSQAGLVDHFLAVAREVSCEIMLYNVPGRTGVSLSTQSICDLAEHPRITSLKEASGSVPFTSEILDCIRKTEHPSFRCFPSAPSALFRSQAISFHARWSKFKKHSIRATSKRPLRFIVDISRYFVIFLLNPIQCPSSLQ